jgi:hypothetical protein
MSRHWHWQLQVLRSRSLLPAVSRALRACGLLRVIVLQQQLQQVMVDVQVCSRQQAVSLSDAWCHAYKSGMPNCHAQGWNWHVATGMLHLHMACQVADPGDSTLQGPQLAANARHARQVHLPSSLC